MAKSDSGWYEYIDHTADICLRGIGETLEEAFIQGARAMFTLMLDIETILPQEDLDIRCQAISMDLLFVEWLSELLAQKDITGLYFSSFRVQIIDHEDLFVLTGEIRGERLDQARHHPKLEVKAVTYCGLHVGRKGDKFIAQCVVDV
ncbi:archease [Candidatus Bipolaricaulota bacterium]|nr:archease [Candidatus Bipolaricaulota bacterium]